MNRFDHTFTPFNIRSLVIPNRIVFPPTVTGYSNPDGSVAHRQETFYRNIAKCRIGMVIVGATAIAPEGVGWMGNTRIDRDEHVKGLSRLFDVIKAEGSVAGIQLYHAGSKTNTRRTGGIDMVAPSAIEHPEGKGVPLELTLSEIHQLEEAFVKATERAFAAGTDFVEYHGAHGYLINQFLSPLFNKRTDEYGGSLENRARFGLNIIKRAREVVGTDPVIGIRISAVEFTEGGYPIEDSKKFCRWFVDEGIDFIDASAEMTPEGVAEMFKGRFIPLASSIKDVVNVPVICVGAIKSLERIEEILEQGHADLVAVCRALIADPELITKTLNGKAEDITECVDCFECGTSIGEDDGDGMKCPQNPDLP
ncbi:MAG: NADH:flavin oxidoreductase [Deltaproteobacteria bacterium]|nr:NADH:flavin oxidoreductase [Deltaproteobacteria bacterium]